MASSHNHNHLLASLASVLSHSQPLTHCTRPTFNDFSFPPQELENCSPEYRGFMRRWCCHCCCQSSRTFEHFKGRWSKYACKTVDFSKYFGGLHISIRSEFLYILLMCGRPRFSVGFRCLPQILSFLGPLCRRLTWTSVTVLAREIFMTMTLMWLTLTILDLDGPV